jgi:membrane-associated protease RseP (regulator of RpoE activity)
VEVLVVKPPRPRYWINLLLLVCTFCTTLLVGAGLQDDFAHHVPAFVDNPLKLFAVRWALAGPRRLLWGLPFCLTLMSILLAHEMGHYLYCRHYRVRATLPFFIPAPTLIGTLGAFIRIRSPIRSRAALFDIGIAGPIAGFVLATAAAFLGLALSGSGTGGPDSPGILGPPLIFLVAHWTLAHLGLLGVAGGATPLDMAYLHPIAIAAWVGMIATSLNLLPGGQLDGGHIVYAAFPRAHRWCSRVAILGLVIASWWWTGWLIWGVLLGLTGMRHPRVPPVPNLTRGRRILLVVAAAILALTFMLAPFRAPAAPGGIRELVHALRRSA